MIVKQHTENHLEFLGLKGSCRGSFESTHIKMPHCWKSHVTAHFYHASVSKFSNECIVPLTTYCKRVICSRAFQVLSTWRYVNIQGSLSYIVCCLSNNRATGETTRTIEGNTTNEPASVISGLTTMKLQTSISFKK